MRLLSHLLLAGVLASPVVAENLEWPKWRGPQGDGISREPNLLKDWPADGPKVLWRANVGAGYSSPIGLNGRVYIFSSSADVEQLICFDADSGKELWRGSYKDGYRARGYQGTRATPTIDGERIYTYGGNGDLVCWNLADGKLIWRKNAMTLSGNKNTTWGLASSPLVLGDRVYVQSGVGQSFVVAFNKNSGEVLWKSEATGKGGYAHIVPVPLDGKQTLLVFAGEGLVAMNPEDGKTLWRYPWTTQHDVNASTPVYRDGKVFITSAYRTGSALLEIDSKGAKEAKRLNAVQSRFQGAILDGDELFTNSEGTVHCLAWPSMDIKWTLRDVNGARFGMGSALVRIDGGLIVQTDNGAVGLIRIEDGRPRSAGMLQLFEQRENWATPLVYRGKLYAKGMQELVCLDIAAK